MTEPFGLAAAAVAFGLLLGCGSDKAAESKDVPAEDRNKPKVGSALGAPPAPPAPPEPPAPPKTGKDGPPPPTSRKIVHEKPFLKAEIPSAIKVKGTVESGVRFADRHGDNWVVFSRKVVKYSDSRSDFIFAKHVVLKGGQARELRLVRDKVEKCDLDLVLDFDDESIEVVDLDNDNVAEVMFGYEMTCAGDVSPSTYKLLVLEGGDKYIIRGTTVVSSGGKTLGGEMKVDKSFDEGPPEFLEHAKSYWRKRMARR